MSYYPNGQVDGLPAGVISMGNTQQGSVALTNEYASLRPDMRNIAERALNPKNESSANGEPSEPSTSIKRSSRFGDTPRSGTPQSRPDIWYNEKRRARNSASPTPSLGMSQTTNDGDSDFEVWLKKIQVLGSSTRKANVYLACSQVLYVKVSRLEWRPRSLREPVLVGKRKEKS